jgi:hypothetical protein
VRLLFDENLSARVATLLGDRFPGSVDVDTLGLRGAPDGVVWDYAKHHSLTTVSKDADFVSMALVRTAPNSPHPPEATGAAEAVELVAPTRELHAHTPRTPGHVRARDVRAVASMCALAPSAQLDPSWAAGQDLPLDRDRKARRRTPMSASIA